MDASWYQRYTETKRLFLPRDKPSSVYPKLCQSIINAEFLSELAHLTATRWNRRRILQKQESIRIQIIRILRHKLKK